MTFSIKNLFFILSCIFLSLFVGGIGYYIGKYESIVVLAGSDSELSGANLPVRGFGPEFLRFLLVGDVVGEPGCEILHEWLPKLKEKYQVDAVIVNGENAMKNGLGISAENVDFFKKNGILAVTSGNHVWENEDVTSILEQKDYLLRPANYSSDCVGSGYGVFSVKGYPVVVMNLMGRFFFNDSLDCPFKTAKRLLYFLKNKAKIILVDFHAEATYEKAALGDFLDGDVSVVVGTHTHIQTADEHILPKGTGFMTDLGCCGSLDSVIGFNKKGSLAKFLYHHKAGKFNVATESPYVLSGALVDIDVQTGKTVHIERIRIVDDKIAVAR